VNAKDAVGGDRVTQFGRVLSELNIDIICAISPQAKDRVERYVWHAAGPAGEGTASGGDFDGRGGQRIAAWH
jgi:hypothetical protein